MDSPTGSSIIFLNQMETCLLMEYRRPANPRKL